MKILAILIVTTAIVLGGVANSKSIPQESMSVEPLEPPQSAEVEKMEDVLPEKQEPVVEAPKPTGCEAVRQEVSKYPDWDVNLMVAISQAESSCRVDALGDTSIQYSENGREYGYSVSAFQVRILPGREHCDVFDLSVNVACAHKIWQGQGLSAWSVYTNGKYLKFL
jgi:hypothetical protein